MKISVITVCYNSEKTIRRTIESVLNQKYPDTDYIIIDGESTDGTVNIIREYEKEIAYWCSEKDNGIYDAMNKGINKSKGDIIAFMNSDDWYENNIFEEVAIYFQKTNIEILYGDYNIVWSDNLTEKVCLDELNLNNLYYKNMLCHQAVFMKRELFNRVGMYNLCYKFAADYEWILRAYLNHVKFGYFPKVICYFRFGGASAVYKKSGAAENRKIKLTLLPDDLKAAYLSKIEDAYFSEYNNIFYNIYNALMSGNEDMSEEVYNVLKDFDNKLILWGAGRIGKNFIYFLSKAKINICSIMDNDSQKWGEKIGGIPIKKPYLEQDKSVKVIISVKNGRYDIKNQLINMGYLEENIINYMDIIDTIMSKLSK